MKTRVGAAHTISTALTVIIAVIVKRAVARQRVGLSSATDLPRDPGQVPSSLRASVSTAVESSGRVLPASLPYQLLWSPCGWPFSRTLTCPAQRLGAHGALQLSHHATKTLCSQTEATGPLRPRVPLSCCLGNGLCLWGFGCPNSSAHAFVPSYLPSPSLLDPGFTPSSSRKPFLMPHCSWLEPPPHRLTHVRMFVKNYRIIARLCARFQEPEGRSRLSHIS